MLTWATRLNDWPKLDAWMADAIRRGVYMNPTMNYEWGGVSRRAHAARARGLSRHQQSRSRLLPAQHERQHSGAQPADQELLLAL